MQPEGFAGYNLTQVTERCTPPYSTFRWSATFPSDESRVPGYSPQQAIGIVDGTDIPAGITPAESGPGSTDWTHDSVERWCQQCVTFAGGVGLAQDSVSIANYMSRTIVNVE